MTSLKRKDALLLALIGTGWIFSLPLACLGGPYPLDGETIWRTLANFAGLSVPNAANGTQQLIITNIRFARVCLAAVCGGILATSGVCLQGVLRNPLAEPFTLGISAGAACGASLAIALGEIPLLTALFRMPQHAAFISLSALSGALFAVFAALWLGRSRNGLDKEHIILAGIAVSTFFGALVALVKALNEESVTSIVFWILGSFQGRGWESMPLLLLASLPALFVLAFRWRTLDVLAFGDVQAGQMGIDVGKNRFLILVAVGCMTAGCVAVAGVIGFVGLVVPHTLRLLLGAAHGPLLIGAFFGGGLLLVWADVIARTTLTGGQEIPVGVVTALLGGPFFALLVKKR